MNSVIKNPAVYAVIAYCLLYLTSAVTFGNDIIKIAVDYGVLGVSLIFFWRWFPNSLEAFKSGGIERKFRLSLGLALTAATLAAQRLWIIIVNQVGVADWINKEMVSSFIGSWFIGAMLLCLSVDGPEDDLATHLRWYYRTIFVGFGVIIGFLLSRWIFN